MAKLLKMKRPTILNAKGEPVRLTEVEQEHCNQVQALLNEQHKKALHNALGYEIDVTTLTTIVKKVSEQKFFEVTPSDYVPITVGNGGFGSALTTYRSFDLSDDFSTGIINTGGNNGRLAEANAGVDSLTVAIKNWAKGIGWSIFELQQAAMSNSWDLVTELEASRKKNWDLGIQKVAFLGMQNDSSVLGLLTQVGITNNTSVITKPISQMSSTELKTFCAVVYEAYRSNCARTARPTAFVVPESDFNGMATQVSPDFPIKTILTLVTEMFQDMTQNKGFKVLPLAYADAAYNAAAGLNKQVYTLLNQDEKSIRMDIPLPYTNTLANSINNFQFQNAAYGQFTGVLAYRPLEMMYFTY